MNDSARLKAEAKTLLELNNHNLMAALEVAQRQLDTIYARAQVLMSLAGIVVTVTGFSGRRRRDRKPRAYATGGILLFFGLALYCASIALMLLDPGGFGGPVR